MATLREKKPGVWEVRVFTGMNTRGRPTQLSRTVHGTKRDAQRLAADMEVGPGRASSGGRLVSDALEAWVEQRLASWAPSSARDQQSRVKAIMKDQIVRVPLARLSVADVERWHARIRSGGAADATVRNLHGVLRAALAQAVRWEWVATNVASLARLRFAKTQQRSVMSIDDVRAVLTAAGEIDPAAVLAFRVAAVTGARRSELAALRWGEVVDDQLTIDSAIEYVFRGDRQPVLREAPSKTANIRTLTLDAETLDMVEALRSQREPYGPWMFGLGLDIVPPDRIGYWWRTARAASGIDTAWRLHDLRHWSAAVAIGEGHDVRTVAGRLGHANPAMTLRATLTPSPPPTKPSPPAPATSSGTRRESSVSSL